MKRAVEIDVKPTPRELAVELSDMGSDDQALFFNELFKRDESWQSSWPMQLQYVTDSDALNGGGREMMRLIGEYAAASSDT